MPAEHLGFKQVKLKSLVIPGDFRMAERLEQPHVKELAASIEHNGQLEPIIVNETDKGLVLVAGGDRTAAHLLAGKVAIWANCYRASDREALEMHLIENGHRRHSKEEQQEVRQRLIELYSEDVPSDIAPEERKRQVHARVAKAMGVQPESVARAEKRKENKQKKPPPPTRDDRELDRKPVINTLGIELSTDWMAGALEMRAHVEEAAKSCTRALQSISMAAKSAYANRTALLQLHEQVAQAGRTVRGAMPAAICPYCKALDGIMDTCTPCAGTALVSDAQLKAAPEELLQTGKKAVVYSKGRKYTVDEWLNSHSPEPEPDRPPQEDPWEALG